MQDIAEKEFLKIIKKWILNIDLCIKLVPDTMNIHVYIILIIFNNLIF